jgi:hypothetical protein
MFKLNMLKKKADILSTACARQNPPFPHGAVVISDRRPGCSSPAYGNKGKRQDGRMDTSKTEPPDGDRHDVKNNPAGTLKNRLD